ncbi:hypothetical protein Fmac_015298 [Flemingia macrophylla]|uniref:Uncharacterized protein n=1 Tax=Flemingia macrophylla TaxID=520843 RepID=A0ABD1MG98_9FABA
MDAFVNLVTQLAANQKSGSVARVCGVCSSNDHHTNQFSARNDAIIIKGVHDVAIDTSAETRKLEGKLDALVNLVTQQATNQKPTSVPRVCGIRSSNDHHTSVCPSSQQSGVDENPEAYAANTYSRPPQQGVHDVATDTSTETRKLVGKLDALVNLVTQQAANQNPASDARVCGIRSSNDNHIRVCPSLQQSGVDEHPWLMLQTPIADHHNSRDKRFSARNDAIVIRGVHDVASDTSAKTRKLEGKVDTFVNLVTQLAANQKPASVARVFARCESGAASIARVEASVLPMTTILVSVLLLNNLEWMSILRLMLQTLVADHHSSRDKALDREDGSQLLGVRCKK